MSLPAMWWSDTYGAVVHEGWRDRPYQVVTSTGLIDLVELPADAVRLDAARPSVVPGDTVTEDEARQRAMNALLSAESAWSMDETGRTQLEMQVDALAAAGLLAPAGTEKPAPTLHALQRIAALVGREGTSLESVVDRCAYLAEQYAASRSVVPVGDVDREALAKAFMAEWRGAGYVNRAEDVAQPAMEACARLAADFALAALRDREGTT